MKVLEFVSRITLITLPVDLKVSVEILPQSLAMTGEVAIYPSRIVSLFCEQLGLSGMSKYISLNWYRVPVVP